MSLAENSPSRSDEYCCCLIASRTRQSEELPDFETPDARDLLAPDERGMFVGHRISGPVQPVACKFPRPSAGGVPNIEMVGSTATRLASNTDGILTTSVRLGIETTSESSRWSEVGAHPGLAITRSDLRNLLSQERLLVRLARDLALSLTRGDDNPIRKIWDDTSDPDSFDLRSRVDSIFEAKRRRGDGEDRTTVEGLSNVDVNVVLILAQKLVVSRVEKPVDGDDAIRSMIIDEADFAQRDRGSVRSVAVVVQSEHVAKDIRAARNDAQKLQTRLHCLIDVISSHLFLLEAAFQVQKQLIKAVAELVDSGTEAQIRQKLISNVWQLRAESLWRFERPWSLIHIDGTHEAGAGFLKEVVSTLGMLRDWEQCRSDVERISAVADYSASHEVEKVSQLIGHIPDVPQIYFPDPLRNVMVSRRPEGDEPGLFRSLFRLDLLRALMLVFSDPKTATPSREGQSRARRLVEIHPFENRDTIINTIGSRITTSALLTATAGLLLGLLLSDRDNLTAPHDALLLLVATISFLFETLMLANVSRGLQFTTLQIARNAERASGVALFVGQYPFAIALALSMTRLIAGEDPTGEGTFLIMVVSALTLIMLVVYFDVIEAGSFGLRTIVKGDSTEEPPRYNIFGRKARRRLMGVLHSLALLLLIGSINSVSAWFALSPWLMWTVEFMLIGMLASMAAMSWVVAGSERYSYYEVDAWDCMGVERASFFDDSWRPRK